MNSHDTYAQLYDLTEKRFSCRSFAHRKVGRDEIKAIIDAARLAPSACNRQPWKFVVADTPQLCDEVTATCLGRDWKGKTETFIIACGNHSEAWHRCDGKDHTDIDLAIAVQQICLAATALGLGSCWICNFDEKKLRQALNIPAEYEPIAIIPIGYPADDIVVPEKKRKPIDEIISWGKF